MSGDTATSDVEARMRAAGAVVMWQMYLQQAVRRERRNNLAFMLAVGVTVLAACFVVGRVTALRYAYISSSAHAALSSTSQSAHALDALAALAELEANNRVGAATRGDRVVATNGAAVSKVQPARRCLHARSRTLSGAG